MSRRLVAKVSSPSAISAGAGAPELAPLGHGRGPVVPGRIAIIAACALRKHRGLSHAFPLFVRCERRGVASTEIRFAWNAVHPSSQSLLPISADKPLRFNYPLVPTPSPGHPR